MVLPLLISNCAPDRLRRLPEDADECRLIILRCQIDGSRKLRLSTMATMVDDKVLCHAFSDGETMVLLDQSQRKIDAGRDACRSPYVDRLGVAR
jgi:hypothetical protein